MTNKWSENYHKYLVPVILPIICCVAFVNNIVIIVVATSSYRFRQATFISMRFFIACLALMDIFIVIFSRGPIVMGEYTAIMLLYFERLLHNIVSCILLIIITLCNY